VWPVNDAVDFARLSTQWGTSPPFDHIVIDDFLRPEVAAALEAEYPAWDDALWWQYDNQIEQKKALNHWDRFPPVTYKVMSIFNSPGFLADLEALTGIQGLQVDSGLNGGGWHGHTAGGKLNVHLDYSLHPKLKLERRLNLIVYITAGWDPRWGGQLGLWEGTAEKPTVLGRRIDCIFNRAVLFDTTQDSWHGLPEPITCPPGVIRKSLAVYYLTEPRAVASPRGKALFAPHGTQAEDPAVLELIRKRSRVDAASAVYVNSGQQTR
jgi:Rps23 Pro-64 3,4-dihydroxylase Tpa1-like proline 4-hydroxylase